MVADRTKCGRRELGLCTPLHTFSCNNHTTDNLPLSPPPTPPHPPLPPPSPPPPPASNVWGPMSRHISETDQRSFCTAGCISLLQGEGLSGTASEPSVHAQLASSPITQSFVMHSCLRLLHCCEPSAAQHAVVIGESWGQLHE